MEQNTFVMITRKSPTENRKELSLCFKIQQKKKKSFEILGAICLSYTDADHQRKKDKGCPALKKTKTKLRILFMQKEI